MDTVMQQILVLTVFGLVMFFVNIKSSAATFTGLLLRVLSLILMLVSLGAAAWFLFGWVF